MGVAEVPGYGQINAGNAYEIYMKYRRGEKFDGEDLNSAQVKYCQSFLSDEQLDEIEYDPEVAKADATNNGEEQITDAKKAKEGDSESAQQGKSVAAQTVTAAGAIAMITVAMVADGWTAMGCAIATLVLGAAAVVESFLFDTDYKNRTDMQQNAENTNGVLDANSEAMAESMDAMNEDMALYEENCAAYTDSVNAETGEMASLQTQLQDAEAAGDTEGAAQIKNQMKSLGEVDHSAELEGLDETKGQLEEYSYANTMADGVSQAGQSVTDFLKMGKGLGAAAAVFGAVYSALAIVSALAAMGVFPKVIPFDVGPAIAGKIMFGVCAALFGTAGGEFINKATGELKCSDSGDDMQEHVNNLNDMIGQQGGYIEETGASYDAADEASAESQGEAQEAADKTTEKGGREAGHPNEPEIIVEEPPADVPT